jgi:Rad3-related DNA helicase
MSESVDYLDDQCISVIVFSVPYPNKNDFQISLKKEYNSLKKKMDPSTIDGDEWYNTITYRSVSQAIGRCIRYFQDFGSIFLLNERFAEQIHRLS